MVKGKSLMKNGEKQGEGGEYFRMNLTTREHFFHLSTRPQKRNRAKQNRGVSGTVKKVGG
jgi:hypothetical protein